jgi:hypothetical protein
VREQHIAPDRQAIEAMEPFERLGLEQICWVASARQAQQAWDELQAEPVLGFDTESKPTFVRNEASQGPHIVQLATDRTGYVLLQPCCRRRRSSKSALAWATTASASSPNSASSRTA